MMDLNLDMITFTDLEIMKENKSNTLRELQYWMDRHSMVHPEYYVKENNHTALKKEIDAIADELRTRMDTMYK